MSASGLPSSEKQSCFVLSYLCMYSRGYIVKIEKKVLLKFLADVNSCSCSLLCRRASVCHLSVVCRLSVTFVHPTQPIEIFGNVSAPCNTLVT